MTKDSIIHRTDLVSPKQFALMFDVDVRAIMAVIRSREIEVEVLRDGKSERFYINLDSYMRRANAEGLTGLGLFRKLHRLCRK